MLRGSDAATRLRSVRWGYRTFAALLSDGAVPAAAMPDLEDPTSCPDRRSLTRDTKANDTVTIAYAVSFTANPADDHVAIARAAASRARDCGAERARLWQRVFGSFGAGDFLFVTEFTGRPAMADYVACAPRATLRGRIHFGVVASELLLERGASDARGSVLELELIRPLPGRWRDTMQAAQNSADFHLAAGAVDCRLLHLDIAGAYTRHIVVSVQYPNLHSWGARRDEAVRRPEVRAAARLIQSADTPVVHVTADVFNEVDLSLPG
jgi:hypothetical protein